MITLPEKKPTDLHAGMAESLAITYARAAGEMHKQKRIMDEALYALRRLGFDEFGRRLP